MESIGTPLYVKPKHAAALLDCSTRTLRTLAAEGTIRKVYIGSMVRYKLSDLENLSENFTKRKARPQSRI